MKSGTCIHFRGTQHDQCAAGVNLRKLVGGETLGWATRLPCLRVFDAKNGERVTCDQFRAPTKEELDAFEKKFQAHSLNATRAAAAIIEHANGKRGVSGKFPCPVCTSGTLHYAISGYNGHKRAKCTTEGCVNFIE